MSNFWGKNAPKSISAGPTSKGRGGGRGREGEGRGEWRVPPPLKPWLRPCSWRCLSAAVVNPHHALEAFMSIWL